MLQFYARVVVEFNDNTRIKLQHPYGIYSALALETDNEGRCVSLEKARRKRRHDCPDAEVETDRVVPHSLRRRRNIVAALKLPRPESVDQLETEIEERGVSIQKPLTERRHDYPARRDIAYT